MLKVVTKNIKFKIFSPNNALLLLIFVDVFSWGFINIIIFFSGIYLSNKLSQDVAQLVGIGTAIYYLIRGMLQIPLGILLDKIKSDRDEIITLGAGVILTGSTFLFYPLISEHIHYYILQVILGIGVSLDLVAWRKLFAGNLDKKKEGLEFGFYETFMSISTAFFSLLAGIVANMGDTYFDGVMSFLGLAIILSGLSAIYLFKIKDRNIDI